MEDWQTTEVQEPDDEYRITSLDTLRVMTDPLRIRIVEELLSGPRTVKQLSQAMEMKPTKLYYHINLLEEHGLIRVVSTRVVSGIIEKLYHIKAYSYPIDQSLMTQAGASEETGLPQVISGLLNHTADEIRRSIKSGLINLSEPRPEQRSFMALHNLSRLSPQAAHDFTKRMEALLEEFDAIGDETSEGDDYRVYGVTVAFYPTRHKRLPHKGKGNEKGEGNG